jgi:glutamate synthase (NADPH/NADH) large chain
METLYRSAFEHDSCGIGAVVNIEGIRTHQTVSDALKIVENLGHRAGKDAKGEVGDGVGILTQIPHAYFRKACKELHLPASFGVGMFFFPTDPLKRKQAMKMFEVVVKKEGCHCEGWREVPLNKDCLSAKAASSCPSIYQAFVTSDEPLEPGLPFDRKLYLIRRLFEPSNEETYICSLSSRTIVYKGMFLVNQLRTFFLDLQQEEFTASIALVHSRFSTNTMPSWRRAHPYRYIMHNGEINTIKGNAGKMLSREENMTSKVLGRDIEKVYPVIAPNGSDSAMLDNTLEFLMMSGMDMAKAVMTLIPEPWQNHREMNATKREFYEYNATMMEPWDGPAAIIFSDGDSMGAVLDRNGLRPSRYYVTKDGYLILSSEVGVLDIAPERIACKERLHPGKMLLVDTKEKRIIRDEEIKMKYAFQHPYGEWLQTNLLHLKDLPIPNQNTIHIKGEELARQKKMFDYAYEDIQEYILPMALHGNEPVVSMGADIPLPFMSRQYQPLFNYFKQLFAQVTNPPIDSIREEIVTSTSVYLGKDGNLLEDKAENVQVLKINNPILSNLDLLKIRHMKKKGFKTSDISLLYYKNTPLDQAIENMYNDADKAIESGSTILILSDRGVDETHLPMPSLLAVSAMHQHLLRTKKRLSCALILETAEPKEVHHFATLLGYGASAINPYLIFDCIQDLIEEGTLDKEYSAAVNDYTHGILKGIVKIASKMGISTLQSYQGSQNFEAIGIDPSIIAKYFGQTVSRIGGITLKDIANQVNARHNAVYDPLGLETNLCEQSRGEHKLRSGKEEHLYNPATIHALQKAVRTDDYSLYKEYAHCVEEEGSRCHIRGMLEFHSDRTPLSIDQVESVASIVQRFKTGAMSYGSISKEAHETMAIAMNRLHARSNTGEGGEEEERFEKDANGNWRMSQIKQVASGRFGVTSNYLTHASEIQIKMAQGAKPGEGGQLPGGKVYPWVAKARHSTPGVTLISPPPHHDIYSIEDLAQLIYDLKCANDQARINVKLVSEAGVGTIAAGVAKAGAQVILISGYDGGTGAAPKNAIYNAGLPWELGLSEAHQTLVMNDLRDKVTLETDGKLMCGRDVAIACLLGAEEFGFATAPLVSMGCVMMRVCNLDTCPVGVATQNPELRKRFQGKPEHVIHFMEFVAQDLREIMAQLGFHTIDEMVGHTECLVKKKYPAEDLLCRIDLKDMLAKPSSAEDYTKKNPYYFGLAKRKDYLAMDEVCMHAMQEQQPWHTSMEVNNRDRAFGTLLGSRITRLYPHGLKEDTFTIDCHGNGGQSFGAFIPKGLTLNLEGDANDYFGKGLSGGILTLKTDSGCFFDQESNILVGNVALYGATSGEAYINGVAGERFCVRNSGATAVCEGCGDHGLEYMTGGTVLILGETGRNFAAGMSGGIAYVYDPDNRLYKRLNTAMVEMEYANTKHDEDLIVKILQEHFRRTGSSLAKRLLDHFAQEKEHFKIIVPAEYRDILKLIKEDEEKGMTTSEAELDAFTKMKGAH